ncbi:protein GL2-INTERACTING REPRESSOR 2-like [Aristolochia californica]|uniref:protein GL2-INTERACTING REPRESSOR 2-like n=1 Tax=Aristolochia californica TaxID=171875 RepID=UPI0035DFC25C
MEGKPVDRRGRGGEERRESSILRLELKDSGNDAASAAEVPGTSSSSNSSPSAASTVTSDGNQWQAVEGMEVTSMVLGGCTRCHMYVMLHREKLRCPRCFSSAVVNFFHG